MDGSVSRWDETFIPSGAEKLDGKSHVALVKWHGLNPALYQNLSKKSWKNHRADTTNSPEFARGTAWSRTSEQILQSQPWNSQFTVTSSGQMVKWHTRASTKSADSFFSLRAWSDIDGGKSQFWNPNCVIDDWWMADPLLYSKKVQQPSRIWTHVKNIVWVGLIHFHLTKRRLHIQTL